MTEKTKSNYVMTDARKAALAKAVEAARISKKLAKEAIKETPISNEVLNSKLDCMIKHMAKLTEQMEFIVNNTPLKLDTSFLK